MLPKKRRISRSEFPYILANGKRYNSQHLLLYLVKNQANKPYFQTKIAFSVSKKVCNTAVGRNKLRRRGYSVVGKKISKIEPGSLGFFVFKKGSTSTSFKALEGEIFELLSNSLMLI